MNELLKRLRAQVEGLEKYTRTLPGRTMAMQRGKVLSLLRTVYEIEREASAPGAPPAACANPGALGRMENPCRLSECPRKGPHPAHVSDDAMTCR